MKEYTPARLLGCEHLNPAGEPTPCPGTCPKLIIKSQGDDRLLGPAQLHAIAFTETELRRLIHEMDKGYFDLPAMPPRKDTRFWDPLTATLIDSLQTNPIQALGILLFLGQPKSVAYQAQPTILALQDIDGGWVWLHLDTPRNSSGDDGENYLSPDNQWLDNVTQEAIEGDEPETTLPQPVTHHDIPPPTAQILWTQTTEGAQP